MARKDRHIYDTNRDISRRPKSSKGWCWGCDRCMVRDGQKCPVCGTRNGHKRNKKER